VFEIYAENEKKNFKLNIYYYFLNPNKASRAVNS